MSLWANLSTSAGLEIEDEESFSSGRESTAAAALATGGGGGGSGDDDQKRLEPATLSDLISEGRW